MLVAACRGKGWGQRENGPSEAGGSVLPRVGTELRAHTECGVEDVGSAHV